MAGKRIYISPELYSAIEKHIEDKHHYSVKSYIENRVEQSLDRERKHPPREPLNKQDKMYV